MIWAALAAAGGAAPPERFDQIDSTAGSIAAIITAVCAAVVTIVKARQASKERVPGDEKEARETTGAVQRTALEEWQDIVAQKDRDLAKKDREIDRWKRIALEYERLHDADRDVQLIHGAWDYTVYETALRADLPVTIPPPIRAPRTDKDT